MSETNITLSFQHHLAGKVIWKLPVCWLIAALKLFSRLWRSPLKQLFEGWMESVILWPLLQLWWLSLCWLSRCDLSAVAALVIALCKYRCHTCCWFKPLSGQEGYTNSFRIKRKPYEKREGCSACLRWPAWDRFWVTYPSESLVDI